MSQDERSTSMLDRATRGIRGRAGFTLVEIMVVILILAVLAAIAVPIFLRQREGAYRAQMQSSLKEASTALESYADGRQGDYSAGPPTIGALKSEEGLRITSVVALTLATTEKQYCIQATHAKFDETWHFASSTGRPRAGACP
ncbi:MAG: type IV pilin protein [Actinomycetota bacterium]